MKIELDGEPTVPSPEDIHYYRENGYVFLENVASQEDVIRIRSILEKIVRQTVARKDTQGRIDDYSSMFEQVTNVWRVDKAAAEFVSCRKFARIAAKLMGVQSVRLYHDQALFKLPGDRKTYWHQDMFYWPLATDKTITMWMPLVDITAEMGTMEFACGSQKDGLISYSPISESAGEDIEKLIARKGYRCRSHELKAGDATFHSGFTLHSAYPNESEKAREVITIIYFAGGAKVTNNPSDYQKVDLNVFLPGIKPGELAASPLNPVLYSE